MRYFSIDLETTGLDPVNNQILSIGAVVDDLVTPLHELPTFHCYIKYPQLVGNPFALALNNNILDVISGRQPVPATINLHKNIDGAMMHFTNWINKWSQEDRVTIAGKNVASFDVPFLKQQPHWDRIQHHNRFLDPGPLYFTIDDDVLPSLSECKKRAGFTDYNVSHDALEDALDVVELIRHKVLDTHPHSRQE